MKISRTAIRFVLLTFACVYAYAQPSQAVPAPEKTTVESVWLWEVDTPHRKIYIAGEIHQHHLLPHETLSHQLAYAAYDASSYMLLEGIFMMYRHHLTLQSRISGQSWDMLASRVRASLDKKTPPFFPTGAKLSSEQKAIVPDVMIDYINHMPEVALHIMLPYFFLPSHIDIPQTQVGFLTKITAETDKENKGKRGFLEMSYAAEGFWRKHCGKLKDTQLLIDEIQLQWEDNLHASILKNQAAMSEFKNKLGTAESMSRSIQDTPLWPILNKCSLIPRNLAWMEKIKVELKFGDKPLMLVAGMGHVVGDSGLLALLCQQGYCQSRRIHQIDK